MRRPPDLEAAAAEARRTPGVPRVATVGYFDGLHVGHQKLLQDLEDWTRSIGGETVVVTFDRHPQEVISGEVPLRILSLEHKLLLLERRGIDAAIVLPFTRELSLVPAGEFVRSVIREGGGATRILMGFDAAFGHRRQGTFEYLAANAGPLGIEVRRSGPALLDGERVSSTLVRTAILAGDLRRLERLLGRRFSLLGRVVRGDGRGRTIGFPTANLDILGAAAPPAGVYFAEAELPRPRAPGVGPERRRWGAVVNIGIRPTFKADPGSPTVEAHLLDFAEDVYGELMEVHFLDRHRDEMKFPSAEVLVSQIRRDIEAFRDRGTR